MSSKTVGLFLMLPFVVAMIFHAVLTQRMKQKSTTMQKVLLQILFCLALVGGRLLCE